MATPSGADQERVYRASNYGSELLQEAVAREPMARARDHDAETRGFRVGWRAEERGSAR